MFPVLRIILLYQLFPDGEAHPYFVKMGRWIRIQVFYTTRWFLFYRKCLLYCASCFPSHTLSYMY